MKYTLILSIIFFNIVICSFAQTGIGTTTPNASAKLDVYATNKGFLPPRVTLTSSTDASTIASPATGLLIYNTGANAGLRAGYYYWSGAEWTTIATTASAETVDYGIARYSGADGGGLVATNQVTFDASLSAGNLAWSNSKFTLKANKSYELESSLLIYNNTGGAAGRFQIYDYTNSVSLANGMFFSMNGTGTYNPSGNSPMKCIVTPTTDIEVGVRLLDYYGYNPGIVGSTSFVGNNAPQNASYFMAKQIGSSAIINPWTLSGTNTYNTMGNVGIGTSSPIDILDVQKNQNATTNFFFRNSNTTNTNSRAYLNVIGGNRTFSIKSLHSDHVYLDAASSSSDMYLQNGGAVTMSLKASGNVGIGTTAPAAKLDVNGDVNTSGNYKYSDGSSTAKMKAGYVNAGVFLELDNIKATVTTSSYRGLSVAAVSTPFYSNIGATYGTYGGYAGGNSAYNHYVSTTPSGSWFSWGFDHAGDVSTYLVNDTTNNRTYRITLSIGASYLNNFISIERLY